jgi:uncharacterized membrane protein
MERIGKVVFFVILFVAVAMKGYAKPTLSLSSATGKAGGNTSLELSISGDSGTFAGVNARIILPEGVSVTNVSRGSGLSSDFTTNYAVSEDNEVTVIAYSASKTFSGNIGTLLTLNLQISKTATKGNYEVKFATSNTDSLINSRHAISNKDGSTSVSHSTSDGTLTIESSSATPSPSPSPSASPAPSPTPVSSPTSVATAQIKGKITNREGNTISKVKVTLEEGKKVKKRTRTDKDGLFVFKDLVAGTYKVTARKKGYKKTKQYIQLKEGEKKKVSLEMRKSG